MRCNFLVFKYILFIFNLIYVLIGLAIVIIFVWTVKALAPTTEIEELFTVVIVQGSIVLILAFLGCCGAITENVYIVIIYAFMLSITLLIEMICYIMVIMGNKTIILFTILYFGSDDLGFIVSAASKMVGAILACILSFSIAEKKKRSLCIKTNNLSYS